MAEQVVEYNPRELLACVASKTVSYTHLTLPTN